MASALVITTLNAQGSFKVTSVYTIVDLLLRIVFLLLLYYVFKLQNIAILPIAECFGIVIGTKLIMARHLPKGSDNNWPIYAYFFSMIVLGFLKTYFESIHLAIDVTSVLLTIIFFSFIIRTIIVNGTMQQVSMQVKKTIRI